MRSEKGEEITPRVIHQDEELLVLDKPSGWIVNDSSTAKEQQTIQAWIAANFKFKISNLKLYRNGIVHRLDKETSGILLIAKNKSSFEFLQSQFKQRLVKKSYVALLHGKVEPDEGTIEAEVGRLPWNRRRFGVLPGGRSSKTLYKLREVYKSDNEKFSLVDFYPETGRTHQIRIHAKHVEHPVVGDTFYAGRKTSRKDRLWCPRLFLHAAEISFTHPSTRGEVKYQSDLPPELESALNLLEKQ